jgi:hypothetical protein
MKIEVTLIEQNHKSATIDLTAKGMHLLGLQCSMDVNGMVCRTDEGERLNPTGSYVTHQP